MAMLLMTAGCASIPGRSDEGMGGPSAASAQVEEGQWQGRFALKVERLVSTQSSDIQQDSVQGSFVLARALTQTVLDLSTPLGQTLLRVSVTPGKAIVTFADGKSVESRSAQDLLEGQLGWRIPIDRLPRALSVLKRSDADVAGKERQMADALGADWRASYQELDAERARLVLTWEGAAQKINKLVLTLIIDPSVGVSANLRR
jgi:outer membrane lipoprotein LolB